MQKHKVKIYSTPTCPYCIMAKEYLKEHKVVFEDVNVAENHEAAEEMVEKSRQRGVPVIVIDDKIVVVGFDRPALQKALGLKD